MILTVPGDGLYAGEVYLPIHGSIMTVLEVNPMRILFTGARSV